MKTLLIRIILTSIVFLVFSAIGFAGEVLLEVFFQNRSLSADTLWGMLSFGVSGCCCWWLLCRKDPPRAVLCGILTGVLWLPIWQFSDSFYHQGFPDAAGRRVLLPHLFFWATLGFYSMGFVSIPAGIFAAKICEKIFASSFLNRLGEPFSWQFDRNQSEKEPSDGEDLASGNSRNTVD